MFIEAKTCANDQLSDMSKKAKLTEKQEPNLPSSGELDASTGSAPLQIIRTETVISRLPIHNLIKGGEINIQISRKNDKGKVSLQWEISPSSRFGHPGQLAYKLDTIVINRIIDEVGRPVPKMIKIGTLNQLCQVLGSQKAELKRALQQNAATTISAKLDYRGRDGSERRLEAIFARYSVIFTGESLPTGEKADEIYIIFNDPYLEVLNSAPVRPLNYDYLKELSPTSQRFYEIISYRIYAAVKYDYPVAKLLYSEYCTYSAQRRHPDFERIRVQMYRVHKPHLESGYLAKVEFRETVDGEGQADWLISYTPGPKARVEYETFNRKFLAEGRGGTLERLAAEASELKAELLLATPEEFESSQAEAVKPDHEKAVHLVQYFHQSARNRVNYQPGPHSKEVGQAEALLTAHGFEAVKFVIGFAVQEARKTAFKMRTFGAIFQYVEDGLRVWALQQNQSANNVNASPVIPAPDPYELAEQQLKALSATEAQVLYEQVKAKLLAEHSAVVRRFDEAAWETTIRAGMRTWLMERALTKTEKTPNEESFHLPS